MRESDSEETERLKRVWEKEAPTYGGSELYTSEIPSLGINKFLRVGP